MPRISEDKRATIVSLIGKASVRQIAKKVDCAPSAVHKIIERFEKCGTIIRKKSTGRPRKTTQAEDKRILSIIKLNPNITLDQIKSKLNLTVCPMTVSRR